jgi:PleD family two-component response regulator
VLGLNGYRVTRVQGGRRAVELARRLSPDAIMVDESLDDISGMEVCRALRDDPLFDHSTPVFLFSSGHAGGKAHADAYTAGAWEFFPQPLHVETLTLKLATFIRAKRELGIMQSKTLFDPMTGLYSAYGLQQMARQMTARASRNHEALACLAIMPELNTSGEFDINGKPLAGPLERVIDVCKVTSRRQDVVGYLGDSRIAILAPATDNAGIALFASRIRGRVADMRTPTAPPLMVRTGWCAFDDLSVTPVDAVEILRRAEVALQHAGTAVADIGFNQISIN